MDSRVIEFQEDIAVQVGGRINCSKDEEIFEDNVTKTICYNSNKSKLITYCERIIKRTIDICAGIVGTIILMPLTAIIFIANKVMKEDGPIFYTQERIGKDGTPFKMYKYRSMVVNADKKLEDYLENNEEARKEYKVYKKLANDPRITKMGKFLRKTSLDEMPQLISVLKGEMSLVGPRPYLLREKDEMGKYYDIIVKCTPGLSRIVANRRKIEFNI